MEILLGARPEPAEDESRKAEAQSATAAAFEKRRKLPWRVARWLARLGDCLEKGEDGSLKMSIALPMNPSWTTWHGHWLAWWWPGGNRTIKLRLNIFI